MKTGCTSTREDVDDIIVLNPARCEFGRNGLHLSERRRAFYHFFVSHAGDLEHLSLSDRTLLRGVIMVDLSISMFGRLQIQRGGAPLACLPPKKARELLAYLLLHRRAHPREKLATLLWHGATKRTKAYLRKALWQLRQSLEPEDADEAFVILAEGDWLQIHPHIDVWVDVDVFETAFNTVRDDDVRDMASEEVKELERAAELYTGDLLENWYHEWCLRERERLRDLFLRMLDRLARYCEHRGTYEAGIEYSLRSLRIDPARERTHRQLMRLRALTGNRTGALRQYERCADVLDRELGVLPATVTRRLHEEIMNDKFPRSSVSAVSTDAETAEVFSPSAEGVQSHDATPLSTSEYGSDVDSVRDGLDRIRKLQNTLATVQRQIRHDIEAVEIALRKK